MIPWQARYHREHYNCRHFAIDAWYGLTGMDISALHNLFSAQFWQTFEHTRRPVNLCIIIYQRRGRDYHVGIYQSGLVLHLDDSGVQRVPHDIIMMGFDSYVLFQCKL